MEKPGLRIFFLAFLLVIVFPQTTRSQYFGRNKPGYRIFKYDAVHTPNFEIYHYLRNDTLVGEFAGWAEEWFSMHQEIFRDTFRHKNPLILYSHHSDFQQTTAVGGIIGTTTGGVTESLKNRVVMPMAPTLAQTDHVLGHELVHAFQFNRLLHVDSIRGSMLNNIPLWMIEGMAEYFSIGSVDPNTAMWMRDAIVNDDFPTLKKLSTESRYFPYRYGHAFWAMIGKTWGDSLILPVFMHTAKHGLDKALDSLLGFDSKILSGLWKNAMESYYGRYISDSLPGEIGKKVISVKNAGRMNLSPSLSPDGKHLAFFSEKDVFTLDLYLADVQTGKIIRKLSSVTRQQDIDDFSFNESAGTWSPDSRRFAFVVFQKGRNKLAVVDVKRARIMEELEFGNILSISNPEWSPDGSKIAFSGMVEGIGDIFVYDIRSGSVTRLTNGFSSKIHPSWSPDGTSLVYCEEVINTGRKNKKFSMCLKVVDVHTREITSPDIFPGADNLNPRFSPDGKLMYFLSNADGFRNLFAYSIESGKVFRLTRFKTGISGLTPFSPAISTAAGADAIAYTLYNNNSYEIYTASSAEFTFEEVDKRHIDFTPGTLPPLNHNYSNIVDSALYSRWTRSNALPVDSVKHVPYKAKFKLDYISNNAGVGVSTGRYNSGNMSGSVSMIFSDMVGNNQLYSVLALNGEIYDFGGQVAYLNQTRKFNWGLSASHIPYRTGSMYYIRDTLTYHSDETGEDYKLPVTDVALDFIRMFVDNISFFTYHPLSQTRRIEAGASTAWFYYRIERYHKYYDDFGIPVAYGKERMPAPEGNNYQKVDLAYVSDNSFFGMTSPMRGKRARYQVEKYFGMVDFYSVLVDYRKYLFINPVTLAFRGYHYGRYGKGSETGVISPLYIGYPWFIRGYENLSYYSDGEGDELNHYPLDYTLLSGSKTLVANVEMRLPLTGPKMLALFRSKLFLTDFNLFFDGGIAWRKGDKPELAWKRTSIGQRIPLFSAGASIRVNVLGYMILEPYLAIPFQNGGWENRKFGMNLVPGW